MTQAHIQPWSRYDLKTPRRDACSLTEVEILKDDKRQAIELIERLPDDVSTSEIIEELYFKSQVDEGLRDVVEGRTLTHQELKERLARWRQLSGR